MKESSGCQSRGSPASSECASSSKGAALREFSLIWKGKGIQIFLQKGTSTRSNTRTADEAPVAEKLAVCNKMYEVQMNLWSRMFADGVTVDALVVAKRLIPAKERLTSRAVFTGC